MKNWAARGRRARVGAHRLFWRHRLGLPPARAAGCGAPPFLGYCQGSSTLTFRLQASLVAVRLPVRRASLLGFPLMQLREVQCACRCALAACSLHTVLSLCIWPEKLSLVSGESCIAVACTLRCNDLPVRCWAAVLILPATAAAQVCTLSSLLPLPLLGLVPNSSGPEAQRKAEDDAEQA